NDPRLVTPREAGGYGLDAQWSDDFHHALHAALTGERQGYYCDFGSLETLKKALTKVFVHDGTYSTYRGRRHGRPVNVQETPAHRFLGYLQNHDLVGNRAAGERIGAILASSGRPPSLLKAGAALLLLGPFTPMLFMGEEWGASTPWCYFTDHRDPELGRAVSEGRRREFGRHGWSGEVPDPQDPETCRRSVLDWSEPDRPYHRDLLEWHRALLALRRSRPELNDPRLTATDVEYGDGEARWLIMRRGGVRVAVNLGSPPVVLPVPAHGGAPPRLLLASDPAIRVDDDTLGGSGSASVGLPRPSVAVLAWPRASLLQGELITASGFLPVSRVRGCTTSGKPQVKSAAHAGQCSRMVLRSTHDLSTARRGRHVHLRASRPRAASRGVHRRSQPGRPAGAGAGARRRRGPHRPGPRPSGTGRPGGGPQGAGRGARRSHPD